MYCISDLSKVGFDLPAIISEIWEALSWKTDQYCIDSRNYCCEARSVPYPMQTLASWVSLHTEKLQQSRVKICIIIGERI